MNALIKIMDSTYGTLLFNLFNNKTEVNEVDSNVDVEDNSTTEYIEENLEAEEAEDIINETTEETVQNSNNNVIHNFFSNLNYDKLFNIALFFIMIAILIAIGKFFRNIFGIIIDNIKKHYIRYIIMFIIAVIMYNF